MLAELRPFLDETFSPASLAACPWLEPGAVAQVWADYKTQGDPRAWSRVWTLAVLIAFANRRETP
jgi:asparagine synthase (glutamine-hydrolysing)